MNFLYLILALPCVVQNVQVEKSNISIATTSVTPLVTTLETEMDDVNVTTEMELMTTCEANSSCFVSTVEPSTNDTSTKANATNTGVIKKKHHGVDTASVQELCTCNLQRAICDINCCCDEDCSDEDKSIFSHCVAEDIHYDTRYCDYMKYIYINNTPFQWHVNQNGLFCVLKSNLPPSYTMQRKQPLTSFKAAEQEKVDKFSWPHSLKVKAVKFNMSEDFVYGNNVWTVYKNQIKKFKVPNKYFSNTCLMKEEILNFKNVKHTCAQIDISEENEYLHFRNYLQDITVVANPNFINVSKYKNLHDCPKNICLVIFPKICQNQDFDNCRNVSRNDSRLDLRCSFDLRNNRNNCKNAVKALQYNFYHNSSQGYTRIEILGVVEDISYELEMEDFKFFQTFQVSFYWVNQTKNYSTILSGNPGYIVGKPILKGNLIRLGNSTNITVKIERIFHDYLDNFLVLPENAEGNCILNKTNYLAIEFGYNILTKCKFSVTYLNKRKYLNGTEICRDFQKMILKMWGVSSQNRTVGMFGNADGNTPEEWVNIIYNLNFKELMNQTRGVFGSKNTTLTCFGLASEVVVDIYHSKIDFNTLLNQEKILGVTYSFGGFVNKTLSYNKQKNNTHLELDLESRVVFYDISVQKRKKFVERPSLEIRLPYDFFYPFIKIDSGVEVWSANIFCHVVLCVIVLFVQ